eukprot:5801757-Pyramimonas_sp.AAC.1
MSARDISACVTLHRPSLSLSYLHSKSRTPRVLPRTRLSRKYGSYCLAEKSCTLLGAHAQASHPLASHYSLRPHALPFIRSGVMLPRLT